MTKHLYEVGNQFIKAPRGFVVYGQYTTAKGCIQALCSEQLLAVVYWPYTTPPRALLLEYIMTVSQ